jgi:hypothetical protein
LRRFDSEAAIELPDVMLAQKGIRRLHRPDSTQAQFLRQPALPGAEAWFAAPRACGEYAGIMRTPNWRSARPTCVSRSWSTASPALAVSQK